MTPPATRHGPRRIVPLYAWPLVALRLLGMVAALLASVPLYYLFAPFARMNPVPPRFLTVIGMIAGLRVRIVGERVQPGSFLLANHVSWLDIPALARASNSAFVAHDGLAAVGPLRWLCEMNDTVFIARHDRRSVAAQVAQVRAALRETGALTIFPEGTTSDGRNLLPFKSSLLSALDDCPGTPVHPVLLDYGQHPEEIAWVGTEPGIDNALRILARWRPIRLTVRVLPALSGADRVDRKAIARAAQAAIAGARNGPEPAGAQRVAL